MCSERRLERMASIYELAGLVIEGIGMEMAGRRSAQPSACAGGRAQVLPGQREGGGCPKLKLIAVDGVRVG